MDSQNKVDAETFEFIGVDHGGVQDAWGAFDFCAVDLQV